MESKTSLILEGGGMRGLYTSGVLDYFLEQNLEFDFVYGVSAGSINGANFVSKQKGRSLATFTDYINYKNYSGLGVFLKTGNYFNTSFVYDDIPNKLNLFDYDTFSQSKTKFYAVVSNLKSGKAEYILCDDLHTQMDYIQASASLPLISKAVEINGEKYLDGGICDSIPLQKSIRDGNEKNIVVLTRPLGYKKPAAKNLALLRQIYKNYPLFYTALANRHNMYNRQLQYILNAEKEGKAFVIRPEKPLAVARLEKNKYKLYNLHNLGYQQAKQLMPQIKEYLSK